MYSKNDYRYYLEDQLMESDDYLAHYGVKGMKWKHRKTTGGVYDPKEQARLNASKITGVGRTDRGSVYINVKKNNPNLKGKISIATSNNRKVKRVSGEKGSTYYIGKKASKEPVVKVSTNKSKKNVETAQDRGKKRTAKINAQKTISAEQAKGKSRTAQIKNVKTTDTKKKKTVKSKISGVRKKYGLYRETPKGKKLKGSRNIYVSYD